MELERYDRRIDLRVAKRAAVAVVASVVARPLLDHRDNTTDTAAARPVVALGAVGSRYPSAVGSAGKAVRPIAGPSPAVAGTSTIVRDVLGATVDEPLGPSPRASCPKPPASPGTCT